MLQKQLLGHSLVSLSDMVAVLGETTGCLALPNLRDKMKNHPEGYHILQCVPPHPSHPRCVVCDGEADTRPSRFLGPREGRAWKQHKCFVSSNPPGCLFHFIFKVHRSSVTHLRAGTAACLFCFTAGTGSCQHHKMQHQAQGRNPWMWMLSSDENPLYPRISSLCLLLVSCIGDFVSAGLPPLQTLPYFLSWLMLK